MSETQPTIAWYYRHHVRYAELESSIEDALDLLAHGEEHGEMSAIGVETSDGFIGDWHKHPHIVEREKRQEADWERWNAAPPPEAKVFVLDADRCEHLIAAGDPGDVRAAAAELISIVGEERVRATINE